MIDKESIIRKLQIDLITDKPNPIIDWFNAIWNKLAVIKVSRYESIYYVTKEDGSTQWIFLHRHHMVWCDYPTFWSELDCNFKLGFNTTNDVIEVLTSNVVGEVITRIIYDRINNYPNIAVELKSALNER